MRRTSAEINRWLDNLDMQEEVGTRRMEKCEKHRIEKSQSPVVGMSSVQDKEMREQKGTVDEFVLGEIFTLIGDVMRKEMGSVVGKTPKEMQRVMKEGLSIMAKAVEDTMSGISDSVKQERKERKEVEKRTDERLTKLEDMYDDKIHAVNAEVERLKDKIEDKVQAVQTEVERLKGHIAQIRTGEKGKEMEVKVKSAMSMVKVLNINIGQATDNKATIVRETLGEVRRNTRKVEVASLDRILKRTRVGVLGRKTEGRQEGGRTVHTVPILFQCQDRKDAEELDKTLRKAGYFPTFHWPEEILEFIGKVRDEVRKTTQDRFIRVRPEIVQDTVRIRADTKNRRESSFVMKGIWLCPPLNRELREGIESLYSPQVVGRA